MTRNSVKEFDYISQYKNWIATDGEFAEILSVITVETSFGNKILVTYR